MLLLDDILLFPIHGILWIFREISRVAHEELAGEAESVTEQLRLLYMRLETGQITEAEFEREEKHLLDRLDQINARLKNEKGEKQPRASGNRKARGAKRRERLA